MRWIGRILIGLVVIVAAFIGAGALFFSDAIVPHETLVAKYGTAPSQFITLPSGAKAHYRDQGNKAGAPLVLLHGSNSSLYAWEPWVKILGDQFRIISVDLPAHGLTGPTPAQDYSIKGMSEFVDEFTTALQLSHFAIGGNSMGGAVTARFAIDHPDKAAQVILVDAGGIESKVKSDPGIGFTLVRIPVVRNLLRFVPLRPVYEDGLKKAFADDSFVTAEMVDRYWEMNNGPGMRDATAKRFSLDWDTYIGDNAGKITAPTLILWGEQDALIGVDVGEAFDAAIPNSKLVVYKGVGHLPMEEAAAQTAADVRAFLAPPPSQAGAEQPANAGG